MHFLTQHTSEQIHVSGPFLWSQLWLISHIWDCTMATLRSCSVCVDSKFVFVPFGYSVCIGIQLYGRTHPIKLRIVSINAARCVISGEAAARLQWTRTLYGAVCTRGKKKCAYWEWSGIVHFPLKRINNQNYHNKETQRLISFFFCAILSFHPENTRGHQFTVVGFTGKITRRGE